MKHEKEYQDLFVAELLISTSDYEATRPPLSPLHQSIIDNLDALAIEADDTVPEVISDSQPETSPAPTLIEIAREIVAKTKADNQKNGKQAQARRKIDEHRKTDGKEEYNAKRRGEYAGFIASTERRQVRPRQKATKERRLEQVNTAVKKLRANRTPEQVAADRQKDAERKANKRREAKEIEEILAAHEALTAPSRTY